MVYGGAHRIDRGRCDVGQFVIARLDGSSPLSFAAVAATHEEAARLVIVCVIAYAVPRQFNDPMDGIICGSIAGLGMAVSESVMYLTLT